MLATLLVEDIDISRLQRQPQAGGEADNGRADFRFVARAYSPVERRLRLLRQRRIEDTALYGRDDGSENNGEKRKENQRYPADMPDVRAAAANPLRHMHDQRIFDLSGRQMVERYEILFAECYLFASDHSCACLSLIQFCW